MEMKNSHTEGYHVLMEGYLGGGGSYNNSRIGS